MFYFSICNPYYMVWISHLNDRHCSHLLHVFLFFKGLCGCVCVWGWVCVCGVGFVYLPVLLFAFRWYFCFTFIHFGIYRSISIQIKTKLKGFRLQKSRDGFATNPLR